VKWLLPLFLLLIAAPVHAAERDAAAEAAATEAHRVRDELCSDGALADTTTAAKSLAEVTEVWAAVSEQLDRSRKVYLLYWRGVLAQCLSQEDRAISDLTKFVDSQDGRSLWESLVADARLRLQRLRPSGSVERTRSAPDPGPILGVVLAGGAGATGGLAIWQWNEATNVANTLYLQPHTGQELLGYGAEGDQHQLISRILVGTSAALGGTALASLIIGGATSGRSTRSAALPPTIAVLPTPDGATLVLAARW
jgi:hypothetical protein